jgi:hypothetical protein
MQRLFALQFRDLDNRESVDYREDEEAVCSAWYAERAGAMAPGFLSFWCWDPKEGWQHCGSVYRITTSGRVRQALDPLPPPEPLGPLPGEGSALEFAPEDFPL